MIGRCRWLVLVALAACKGSTPDAAPSEADAEPSGTPPLPHGGVTPPDPACAAPGCLRTARKLGDFTKATIEASVDPRVTVDNGYTVWSIEYLTGDRTSLATIAVPFELAAPPRGFPIVANNHGTTGLDDPCALTGTVYGAGLAGLFGARGMIGVAPDYPGIGTPGVHPYLVSDVEGRASLDALRAARSLARWQGIRTSERFGVAGLSQGGHATIAAAALHAQYAPELDIRGFAAAAPASLFEEQWHAGLAADGPQVVWHTMLVYAWMNHYGYVGPSPWAAGIEPTVRTAMTSRCVLPINGAGSISAVLGGSRDKIFAPAFTLAYQSGQWGAYAPFAAWFGLNRVRPYTQAPTAQVKIYQGDADTTVLESGTRAVVDALRAGGVMVDYEVVPSGTHTDVAFGLVSVWERRTQESIAWMRARVESP
jgi:hypothetical protein